jgi:hypothetical protein
MTEQSKNSPKIDILQTAKTVGLSVVPAIPLGRWHDWIGCPPANNLQKTRVSASGLDPEGESRLIISPKQLIYSDS